MSLATVLAPSSTSSARSGMIDQQHTTIRREARMSLMQKSRERFPQAIPRLPGQGAPPKKRQRDASEEGVHPAPSRLKSGRRSVRLNVKLMRSPC